MKTVKTSMMKTPTRLRVALEVGDVVVAARAVARQAAALAAKHPEGCGCPCCESGEMADVLADLAGLRWACETASSTLNAAISPVDR